MIKWLRSRKHLDKAKAKREIERRLRQELFLSKSDAIRPVRIISEHCRTRLRTLTERYVELNQKADAAKAAGDLDRAHQCRVRARRAYSALHKLSDSPLFDDNAQWAAPLRAVLLSLRNRPTNRPMNKAADRYAEGSTQQR